jgi:hypothetical protein
MNSLERGAKGKLVCAGIVLVGLTACAILSLMWWPMYWYVVNEIMPARPVRLTLRPSDSSGAQLRLTASAQAANSSAATVSAAPVLMTQDRQGQRDTDDTPAVKASTAQELGSDVHSAAISTSQPVTATATPEHSSTSAQGGSAASGSLPPVPERAAPLTAKQQAVRADTVRSGHGVASDAAWRRRRPRQLADDQLVEKDYLMDRCTHTCILPHSLL